MIYASRTWHALCLVATMSRDYAPHLLPSDFEWAIEGFVIEDELADLFFNSFRCCCRRIDVFSCFPMSQ